MRNHAKANSLKENFRQEVNCQILSGDTCALSIHFPNAHACAPSNCMKTYLLAFLSSTISIALGEIKMFFIKPSINVLAKFVSSCLQVLKLQMT
jgi:hypothetical protein